jgi:hypothetical protein
MFESIGAPARPNWKFRVVLVGLALALVSGSGWVLRMTQMPLASYKGPLAALSPEQEQLGSRLSADVRYLSSTIGERSMLRPGSLQASIEYLRTNLQRAGYTVVEDSYLAEGQKVSNLEASLVGSDSTSAPVIVGAHYDSVAGTVGANDNATGVAAVLELARLLQGHMLRRTVRFVLFVNEEPPFFQTGNMGSRVYAGRLRRDHVRVSAMISLETIGYYSDAEGSQRYPPVLGLFYPSPRRFRRICRELGIP